MTDDARRIVDEHMAAIRRRDLDAIVATYAPDAVLADTDRIGRGHDYIREIHGRTLDSAAALDPQLSVLEDGEVVFVTWRAVQPGQPVLVGANTFVVSGGLITVNTAFLITDPATSVRLDADPGTRR